MDVKKGNARLRAVLYLFLMSVPAAPFLTAHAQSDTTWTEATGKCYSTNVTPEQGWVRARRDAEANAIRDVLGISLTNATFGVKAESMNSGNKSNYFSVFSELSRSTTSGRVTAEEIISKTLDVENDNPVYVMKIRAKVAKDQGVPDPAFTVHLTLDKDVYYDRGSPDLNDVVNFSVDASENCYLYLFDIMSNDSVMLLIPNPYFKDNYYSAADGPAAFRKRLASLPIKLRVGLQPGRNTSTEMLYLVALKKKIDFYSPYTSGGGVGIIPTYRSALLDLQKWLVRIPRDLRTSDAASFTIRRRQ